MCDTNRRSVRDASIQNENIRIANRKLVSVHLLKNLVFEVDVNCFDVNVESNILVTCTFRIIQIWNLEDHALIHQVSI